MPNSYSDLEIEVLEEGSDTYSIEMRFVAAGSDSEVRLLKDKTTAIPRAQLLALKELKPGSEEYGVALAKVVFEDPLIAVSFEKARSASQALNSLLRVRLLLDANLPDLHDVHWECLRDVSGNSLFTNDQILFSRYLPSLDWRAPKLPVGKQLKALVAIANPTNLSDFESDGQTLTPIDVNAELVSAKAALSAIAITVLDAPTLESLTAKLREGFDIFYLVCHGAVVEGKSLLMLCDGSGKVELASGADLEARFRDLSERPRLVVLASCQSARGTHSLGPMLAGAGVPAVLAMQGNLSMKTNAIFMPAFFRELILDGLIDRAMSVARGAIRDQSDSWMPILYMRLRTGMIWQDDPVVPVVKTSRFKRNMAIAALVLAALIVAFYLLSDPAADLTEKLKINYTIVLQQSNNGAEPGIATVLPVERPFRKSDRVAINIEAPQAGHLYIFADYGDDPFRILYPFEKGSSSQVNAGQNIRIPGKADNWISLRAKTVSVIWSPTPILDIETAIGNSDRDAEDFVIRRPADIKILEDTMVEFMNQTRREVVTGGTPHSVVTGDSYVLAYRFKLEIE